MFGAPSSTSAGAGFSFGSTSTSTAPSGGGFSGFSFGAAAGSTPATTAGGFAGFGLAGSTPSSTAATGFNFGAPKPANGTTTGFGFNMGQQPPASQPPSFSSSSFSFGQPTSASESSGAPPAGSLASGTSLGFGFKTDASSTQPTTAFSAPSTASGSLLSGLLNTPASTAATSTLGAISSITPSTGFSFGAPSTTLATTSTASSTAGFGFGFGASSTAPATTSTTASTAGFGMNFGATQQTSAAPTLGSGPAMFGAPSSSAATITSSLPLSTSAVSSGLSSAPKQMSFRQLEDTINKWTTELEEQESYFLEQATQVNAWDRVVMENGEKIIQLNKDVEKVKLDQQKLDHELDFVQSQQKELEDILVPLETALDSLPPISYQQHADIEREHTYMLAESLDAQLKRMGQDLKEIIERLNANNSKPEADDPVHQITKILNAHIKSLTWVDRNTVNLQKRVEEISRQMDIEKREQEKYFRLAYS